MVLLFCCHSGIIQLLSYYVDSIVMIVYTLVIWFWYGIVMIIWCWYDVGVAF